METGNKKDRSILLIDIFRWLMIAVIVAFCLWLFGSCVDSSKESRDKREHEQYMEAYNEGYGAGWYDGQEALIEYIQYDWDGNEKLFPRER